METRKIGSLDVSIIGLGTNNFGFRMDEADVPAVVDAALEAGINFFDTADAYGRSERRLAAALGARREDVVVATKFASPLGPNRPGGARPEYIRSAVERSLRELATDRVDLYQIHRPDPDTPIADTLAALDELVEAGCVREIGCSNFSAEQLVAAADAVKDGAARFVSVQNHYNLLHRRRRGGRPARLPAAGVGPHPVLSARQRPVDRQVPARGTPARGHPPGRMG